MNGQVQNLSIGPERISQESLLFAALERLVRIREGRTAVRLHLSRLRPQNRREGYLRIVLRLLEPMVNAYGGQIFLLDDSDMVFLLRDARRTDVETMIAKLRSFFSRDPLIFADENDGVDRFCSRYDLAGDDYKTLLETARQDEERIRQRGRARGAAAAQQRTPLGTRELSQLLDGLEKTEVAKLIRRRWSIVVTARSTTEVFAQEFSINTDGLQKLLGRPIDFSGNSWLIKHLNTILGGSVLSILASVPFKPMPSAFLFDLNLYEGLSDSLARFERHLNGRAEMMIEFHILDVLADSGAYYTIRDKMQESGYKVIIEGLDILTTQCIEIAQFGADYYKLGWNPEMRENEIGAIQAAIDPEQLILEGCESESAIQWGLAHGINRFQGTYVAALLSAYAKAEAGGAACSLAECIAARSVVAGPLRERYAGQGWLDAAPVIRAGKTGDRKGAPS